MSLNLLKTGALTAAALLISISGAFAAQMGTITYDTKVKADHSNFSPTVNHAQEGDDVLIIDYTDQGGGWFEIKLPGPDGWVRKSAVHLDFNHDDHHDHHDHGDHPQVCFTGPLGHICVAG